MWCCQSVIPGRERNMWTAGEVVLDAVSKCLDGHGPFEIFRIAHWHRRAQYNYAQHPAELSVRFRSTRALQWCTAATFARFGM